VRSKDYPLPGQGETFGDPGEIECPTCGRANEIDTADGIDEGDEHECAHCDAPFVVTGVDYRVTITVEAKKPA
jgi:hypothetical protein